MDNKSIKLVFIIFFILLLLNIVYAQSLNFSENLPKIAYIYKSKSIVDKNIVNIFNSSGFLVDFIHESNLPMDLSKYRFIYIGDEAFSKLLPIDEYPSIISNYFIGPKGGLTDNDGISKLVALQQPLKVSLDGKLLQVYTKAEDKGYSIFYYYLDKSNKAPVFKKIAGTYSTSSGLDFGDVVSYADKGSVLLNGKISKGDICFFGIVETNYWTNSAKELFLDCIEFVNKYNPSEGENQTNNQTNNTNIICSKDLDCDDKNLLTSDSCLDPGENTSVCEHKFISDNQTNNTNIICSKDLDCGISGFIGLSFCLDNDVVKNYISFNCINPNNISSYCSNKTEYKILNNCSFCSDGSCKEIKCSKDLDCDDKNPLTLDSCLDSGTTKSVCFHKFIQNNQTNNTNIFCSKDLDCDDKNPLTLDSCLNPGTNKSICEHKVIPKFVINSLSAEVFNTSVILHFHSDYSSIKGYHVRINKSGWIFISSNNYTYKNLSPLTNYTFYVKALDMTNKVSDESSITVTTLSASTDGSGGSGGGSGGSGGSGGGSGGSGGSGGGSGGSGGISNELALSSANGNHRGVWCITEWKCSEWSKCINDEQTRICNYPPQFCEPYDPKPIEKQICIVEEESGGYSSSLENKENSDLNDNKNNIKKPLFPITGAAIAAAITKYPWIALGILLIIFSVGYYLTNKYYFIPKKKVRKYRLLKDFFKLFY